MTDIEDCARFLREIAEREGREALAVNTVDEFLIRNGDQRAALLVLWEHLSPPDTSVARVIRNKLGE